VGNDGSGGRILRRRIIIETRDTINYEALNGYDAGGNGDFSVQRVSAREIKKA
jgi:hypothetical protein